MAFSHPARIRHSFDPQLLILIIAIFLFLLSFLAISMVSHLYRERIVPDAVIANQEIPVYFTKLQGSQSITESAPRSVPKAHALEATLQELLKGPTAEEQAAGYYTEIPPGTRLLGTLVQGNRLTINLSKEFASGSGATSVIQRINELKRTLSTVDGHHAVQIVIEGKPIQYMGDDGLEID
jgi:spore germination protein GerM